MTKNKNHEPSLEVRAEQPYIAIPIKVTGSDHARD